MDFENIKITDVQSITQTAETQNELTVIYWLGENVEQPSAE